MWDNWGDVWIEECRVIDIHKYMEYLHICIIYQHESFRHGKCGFRKVWTILGNSSLLYYGNICLTYAYINGRITDQQSHKDGNWFSRICEIQTRWKSAHVQYNMPQQTCAHVWLDKVCVDHSRYLTINMDHGYSCCIVERPAVTRTHSPTVTTLSKFKLNFFVSIGCFLRSWSEFTWLVGYCVRHVGVFLTWLVGYCVCHVEVFLAWLVGYCVSHVRIFQ